MWSDEYEKEDESATNMVNRMIHNRIAKIVCTMHKDNHTNDGEIAGNHQHHKKC